MIYSIRNKDGLGELEELVELKSKIKQLPSEKKDKHGFHYDTKGIFEPIIEEITKQAKNTYRHKKHSHRN